MMNKPDKLIIAQRLLHDPDSEMTRDELQQLLDEELARPEEEMDVQLVEELLALLEDASDKEADQPSAWQALQQRLPRRKACSMLARIGKIAAVLLVLAGLTVLTFQSADAFNWQYFKQLFFPGADHFIVYSDGDSGQPSATVEDPAGLETRLTGKMLFTSEEEAPEHLLGYPVRLRGLPARYTYLQGELYSDNNAIILTHVFASDDDVCVFTATVIRDTSVATIGLYRKTPENVQTSTICGIPVHFYAAGSPIQATAAWMVGTAQYTLSGDFSHEELTFIIHSTIESEPMEE